MNKLRNTSIDLKFGCEFDVKFDGTLHCQRASSIDSIVVLTIATNKYFVTGPWIGLITY